ncbi:MULTISPECIES: hypothetical protein [Azospirillum]|uniref:Uncharacterized protein n=2 Tax=Azospirillum brasilense TaxID=192 RepID=A0ABU4PEE7_AZOBR|nr:MULTISPECIES: hypothetical protein [Azospirillum]MDX5955963.1 hypothetical protein [Azospirillum brasilense]
MKRPMMEARRSSDIGLRRGRILPNLPQSQQLDLIADGLPVLMKSAQDLLSASKRLGERGRVAIMLESHATEELAKALILVDIVRCPPKLRPSRIATMMGWFYDHLARLIYVDAQSWKPTSVTQLQSYVDDHRKSHYLEGSVGEYIFPNWTIYMRESLLYADLITHEDGVPMWNDPVIPPSAFGFGEPSAWRICQALQDMGAFTRHGLDVMSSAWRCTEFAGPQSWSDTKHLTRKMLEALESAGLISERATSEQVGTLLHNWQMPMYNIDFEKIDVPLNELQADRDANLWSEYGDWP